MDALVIASASWASATKHLLKNDKPRVNSTTIVTHARAGFVAPTVVVCVMSTTTADAKQSIASSMSRARVKSKESAIIVSESAIHILLLGVGRVHFISTHHENSENVLRCSPFSKSQSKHTNCDETWQDVFLTKPEYGGSGVGAPKMDDTFVAPVMSIAVQRERSDTQINAKPVKGGSNWLMLAYPGDATSAEVDRWRSLEPGDMIRVGTAGVGGFTDYLTVLETLDADRLYNTTGVDWEIATLDPSSASTTIGTVFPDADQGYHTGEQPGRPLSHLKAATSSANTQSWAIEHATGLKSGSLRCVRINYAIDATTIDPTYHKDTNFTSFSQSASYVTDATRGEVSVYYPLSGVRKYDGADRREMFYFPCYRQREWVDASRPTTTVLRLQMPTNVKQIRAVKLMGYSMVHKRAVGTQQQHERKEDDWYAIRIKELHTNNSVLSNNQHAQGALHVLHAGNSGSTTAGSVELYEYDPHGLSCASFSPINLPSLTVEVVDRQGNDAHFGRMHLWLRILTTQG